MATSWVRAPGATRRSEPGADRASGGTCYAPGVRRFIGLGVLAVASCGSVESPAEPPLPVAPAVVEPVPDRRRCAPPPGVSGSPRSITAAIELVNALPPPVDVACFVESLDRPLEVFATASAFSAQPSADVRSPRLFIRNGPLTMSVVPIGIGARLLEFSERTGERRSIKGELELPPTGPLAPSAAFDRIRVGETTTCGTCHDDEAPAVGVEGAYASEMLRAMPEFDVPLANLASEAHACDGSAGRSAAARCALLSALFANGEVGATVLAEGRLCHG